MVENVLEHRPSITEWKLATDAREELAPWLSLWWYRVGAWCKGSAPFFRQSRAGILPNYIGAMVKMEVVGIPLCSVISLEL